MEKYIVEDGITYMLEVISAECICGICEDLRSAGYQVYESFAYLGKMMIGSDCGACSEEEAFDSAEDIYQMFHRGELGYRPQDCFTSEAIDHVRLRRTQVNSEG